MANGSEVRPFVAFVLCENVPHNITEYTTFIQTIKANDTGEANIAMRMEQNTLAIGITIESTARVHAGTLMAIGK